MKVIMYSSTIDFILDYVLPISGFLLIGFGLFTFIRVLLKDPQKAKEGTLELILKKFRQQQLSEAELDLIYRKKIVKEGLGISYIEFLESIYMYVLERTNDVDETNNIIAFLKPIIAKEKAEKPYSRVKDRERRILLAIEEAAKNGEKSSVSKNLEDLSMIIEADQKALVRARKTNKWSIPTSILGILLTLFSLIFGFVHKPSLSKEDIKTLSTEFAKQVDSISDQKRILEYERYQHRLR